MAIVPKKSTASQPIVRMIVEFHNDPGSRASVGLGFAADSGPPDAIAALLADAGARVDADYGIVELPQVTGQNPMQAGFDSLSRFSVSDSPADSSYLMVVEGTEDVAAKLTKRKEVAGVFADVQIEPMIICPGSAALGNTADVQRLVCATKLNAAGMDGSGVLLAIVDTGINRAHLAARGIVPTMDAARSWVPTAGMIPFDAPVGHGTMCAYDALITAPRATLLDIQLLRATGAFATTFLSEAVRAYAHLQALMTAPRRPGEARSLVVNNSWGMFHPSWDFPVGHPGNYSNNPNHPFNRSVAALETMGADILFAAGNCGADCPDGRCSGVVTNAIYGANGHPSVLTVAGVDTTKVRVGYSTQGPGRLSRNKPDICGYTHFSGSGVYAADGGTSAACPVVAGVVAAARTRKPFIPGNASASPHAMRELIRSTAEDLGTAGFDFNHGFGVINGCAIADRIVPPFRPVDICARYPRLCDPRPVPVDFCRRYPDLCRVRIPEPFPGPLPGPFPGPRPGPFPGPGPGPFGATDSSDMGAAGDDQQLQLILAAMWEMGYRDAKADAAPAAQKGTGGCNCS